MSALNLVPDLEVLCAQTGIFLANLFVVKKLIINPYLDLRSKREALTTGTRDAATKTLAACADKLAEIETRVRAVHAQAGVEAARIKADAAIKQQQFIAAAKEKIEQELQAMRENVAQQAQVESKKIPELAGELTKEFYQNLIR